MSMDRKFSDEVIGLGAVYVRVPSSDELVEKLKGDKEFIDAVKGERGEPGKDCDPTAVNELAEKVKKLEKRVKKLEFKHTKEMLDLSRWTGIPVEELAEKTPEELEKIAPFVLEVVATGEPIELKIKPTTLEGYVPQGEGMVTLNGKPINEVNAEAGEVLELVIPAGYHSVEGTFKGFTAKRLVLMSGAMLKYVKWTNDANKFNDIYNAITEVYSSAFRYATSDWIYESTFYGCTSLTSIPENLFAGVQGSEWSMFDSTFFDCTSLTSIPEKLFAGVQGSAGEMFQSTFYGCTSLTSIPENLFAGVQGSAEYMFCDTFGNCTSLTSIPENLFAGVQGRTKHLFRATFYGCKALMEESPRINGQKLWVACAGDNVGNYCFYNCSGLSDYAEIPSNWK